MSRFNGRPPHASPAALWGVCNSSWVNCLFSTLLFFSIYEERIDNNFVTEMYSEKVDEENK
jgi:hypothetical protein